MFAAKPLPPVTVLIPAYNVADYISDAILSAASQDYLGELHVIVLDDGSSDSTLQRAERVASQFTNVQVVSQSNRGRAGARNRLLELSTTEIASWIDGDDMAPRYWVSEQVSMLLDSPRLIAVSGQGYAMNAKGLPIGPIPRPIAHAEIEKLHLSGQSNAFFQSCTTVKKSAVLAVGGYRLEYSSSEDYDLWLRMAEVGQLQNHVHCHLYYRVHSASANAILSREQRREGLASANTARSRRGLPALKHSHQTSEEISNTSPTSRENWHRHIYWINIAMRSGNPRTALTMIASALLQHPQSLFLWGALVVSATDTLLQFGNRSGRFQAGHNNHFGALSSISVYRLVRWMVQVKRKLQGFHA